MTGPVNVDKDNATPLGENDSVALAFEIVCFTKAGGPLTKRISLNSDGSTKSDGSECRMARGAAARIRMTGVAELATLISDLGNDQAISLGALRADLPDEVGIVTKGHLRGQPPNVVARTADSIRYRAGQPGFALFDFDSKGMPHDVEAKLAAQGQYWDVLCQVLPGLHGAAHVHRKSTSAGLLRTDTGKQLPGSKGVHIYVAVKDSTDIDRFLKTLHERCWLAGFGWLMVGAGGQMLERSIVDRMVGTPERLVFEGAPVLVPPLAQDEASRRPQIVEGEMIDTVDICPPLSIRELAELKKLRAIAEQGLAPEAAKERETFIAKQAERLAKRTGMPKRDAARVIECQIKGVLLPDLELQFDDEELVGKTVADVLADPDKFVGVTLADPLEGVEYGTCKAKIMRRSDGTLWINSFAHGRTIYEMKLDARAVRTALEAASSDEVVSKFIELALLADLDPVDLEQLLGLASKRSDIGVKVIMRTLKAARDRAKADQAEQDDKRRQAVRADPRPSIPAPEYDAPWLPQMRLLDDVLGSQEAAEPPMRNADGLLIQCRMREPSEMHAFGHAAANGDAVEEGAILPPPKQHLLTVFNENEAAELIERYIDFVDAKDGRSVHLASPFVRHYMQRSGGALPVVGAVATLPLVLADGVVLTKPGLDRDRGIIFRLEPGIVAAMPRPQDCGKDRVAEAMKFLTEDWLADVATTYTGKCVLIAAALTIIERSLLPERPTFWISAGRRGGGKTTANGMIIMATLGTRPAAAAWAPNEDERRKALLSYFMEGVAYILWDNIPRGTLISCPSIERSCTTATYSDRKLGVSEQVQTSSTTVHLFTGNNIAPKGDLSSRSLQVRLEVERADPENRPFRHSDPIGWTEANRVSILQALYTVLIGNPELAKPRSAPAKTRFKMWWRLIGSAIENAAKLHSGAVDPAAYDPEDGGRPVPVDFQKLFLEQETDDDDSSSLAEVLAVMSRLWSTFKASDVAGTLNAYGNTSDSIAIREFLFPGTKTDQQVTAKSVSKRLIAHVGNPVRHGEDTLALAKVPGGADHSLSFFVKTIADSPAAAA